MPVRPSVRRAALAAAGALVISAALPGAHGATPGAGQPEAPRVEVRFVQPEQFADTGRGSFDRERVLAELQAHLQRLGEALPAGQQLLLEVTDVDLAGDLRPWGGQEVRVLRGGADWPLLVLRYTLSEGGRTLKSGEARLSDLNYLQGLRARDMAGGESLAAEKRMVQRWFASTFGMR